MKVIIPAYLPSIYYFSWLIEQDQIEFATNLRYQKQTYRNRAYIYGANGKHRLVVPIIHNRLNEFKTDQMTRIFNETNWRAIHWKSLDAAYRRSPYFEYYEDALYPLYQKKWDNLFDFNLCLIRTFCDLLSVDLNYRLVASHKQTHRVFERLLDCKNSPEISMEKYPQVFENKFGFIPNLSIVDLLFNTGPETLDLLKTVQIISE